MSAKNRRAIVDLAADLGTMQMKETITDLERLRNIRSALGIAADCTQWDEAEIIRRRGETMRHLHEELVIERMARKRAQRTALSLTVAEARALSLAAGNSFTDPDTAMAVLGSKRDLASATRALAKIDSIWRRKKR